MLRFHLIPLWSLLCLAGIVPALAVSGGSAQGSGPARLRALAHEYFSWRNEQFPVFSSDQGLHRWDDRLTDYSLQAVTGRRERVKRLLAEVTALQGNTWSRDDRIDWLLFQADLERAVFSDRVLRFEETNPQTYVNECSNAIFSLLKKDYDTPRNRSISATA